MLQVFLLQHDMSLIKEPYTSSPLTECAFREALLTTLAAIDQRQVSDNAFRKYYDELREHLLHAIARARAHAKSCRTKPKGLTRALAAAAREFRLTRWEASKVGDYMVGLTYIPVIELPDPVELASASDDSDTMEHPAQRSQLDYVERTNGMFF